MNRERATKKQQELLEYVDGFIREHDYGPSYREIMRALDYKSVSTVASHVDGLITKGFLTRKDNSARSLAVASSDSVDNTSTSTVVTETEKALRRLENQADRMTLLAALRLLGYKDEVEKMEKTYGQTPAPDPSTA